MSDVVDLTEDDDFLSMVEAAEAKAKRQKLSAAAENSEGSYMAALRGSRSLQWQQQQMKRNSFDSSSKSKSNPSGRFAAPTSASAADSSLSTPAAGACFKCGKSGHWARECAGSSGAGGDGGQGNQTVIAEKPCPCGFGACLVLTANTEKNRGRKFYRCPVRESRSSVGVVLLVWPLQLRHGLRDFRDCYKFWASGKSKIQMYLDQWRPASLLSFSMDDFWLVL
ncbi:hypothetical protein ACLOJK_021820 [Asimina triloba]